MAPNRRAVAMACKPATPAPTTKTLAGVSVPAAVIIMGNIRGEASAAGSTALYPATVAIDDNTSIDCHRVMRGNSSKANVVMRRSASAAIGRGSDRGSHGQLGSGFPAGSRRRQRVLEDPRPPRDVNDDLGRGELATVGGDAGTPAERIAGSRKPALSPALVSTSTSKPAFFRLRHVRGDDGHPPLLGRRLFGDADGQRGSVGGHAIESSINGGRTVRSIL